MRGSREEKGKMKKRKTKKGKTEKEEDGEIGKDEIQK